MSNIFEFLVGQTKGSLLARASVTETYQHFCVSRDTNIYGRAAIPKPLVPYVNANVVCCSVTLTKTGQLISEERNGIFQDDNVSVHAAELVQLWFDEHEEEVNHLPRPA
ncbi:hypothetical protein TNCV_5083901, partial [Trichonephila clavipes]